MSPRRSLSDKDPSQSSPKRPSRSSKSSSSLKETNSETSSSVKNNNLDSRPIVYGPRTVKRIPPVPPSVHLLGKVPNSITAKTTTPLQDQFSALRGTVPHLSNKDWRAISYFQESAYVVLNQAYIGLYEKHQPQSTQARNTESPAHKRLALAPWKSGHEHDLPKTQQTSIHPLTSNPSVTPSLSNLNDTQPPWQHAPPLNHPQPINLAQPLSLAQPAPVLPHRVSPPHPKSMPGREACPACVSTHICTHVQRNIGEEIGTAVRASELRHMLGAMTTDELIRVAAKKRYAIVPIDTLSSQRPLPAVMDCMSNRSRSVRLAGWQLNSSQRREVIGLESAKSLVGGESEASSAQQQWMAASEAEAEAEAEQGQQLSGGGLVHRASEWMGHLFGRGKALKRKQDACDSPPDTQGPREGSSGYGRGKRVRGDSKAD
ncbi:hypothetical protein BGZ82_001046 [Podila clonocystis]|nr:hypothetical protein BGZ82_001046 [Podila clonocystis]